MKLVLVDMVLYDWVLSRTQHCLAAAYHVCCESEDMKKERSRPQHEKQSESVVCTVIDLPIISPELHYQRLT